VTHSRCVIVTGGARGIGAAIAHALAGDGWAVAVLYRSSQAEASHVCQLINDGGGAAFAVQADVTNQHDVDRAFAATEAALGPVLGLVNNAGIRADALTPHITDEQWNTVMSTNLSATFRTTRRALPKMIRARFGRVVNVASIVGPRANPGQANYAAAKAGVIGLTKTVAAEVARRGITVNAVAPGFVRTDLTADVPEDFLERVPARRAGKPEEIAACVRFLASASASYVTGATLVVDGGFTA
jgi:3-oxoacyl-[acyl-carrier protein] reductase